MKPSLLIASCLQFCNAGVKRMGWNTAVSNSPRFVDCIYWENCHGAHDVFRLFNVVLVKVGERPSLKTPH